MFKDSFDKRFSYRTLFSTEMGQKVLIDLLQQLYWLPGGEKSYPWSKEEVETLRSFAVILLGGGGLDMFTEESNEEFVRSLFSLPLRGPNGEET